MGDGIIIADNYFGDIGEYSLTILFYAVFYVLQQDRFSIFDAVCLFVTKAKRQPAIEDGGNLQWELRMQILKEE